MNYTVDYNGHYTITSEIVTYTYTGVLEEVKNPKRKWYTFWIPKVVKPIYDIKVEHVGKEIVYLEENQVVVLRNKIERIGG